MTELRTRATPRLMASVVRIFDLSIGQMLWSRRSLFLAVLLGLSLSIEGGTMSWDELRAAVALVMSYPAVGRRVMPALTPFFERAA